MERKLCDQPIDKPLGDLSAHEIAVFPKFMSALPIGKAVVYAGAAGGTKNPSSLV
jgi:hypothetical protein